VEKANRGCMLGCLLFLGLVIVIAAACVVWRLA
jgi:hypothetical protein